MLTSSHKVIPGTKLDYNDVLIVPRKSTVTSRSNVDLNRTVKFKHSKQQWSGIPIISSNMDTVTNVNTFNVLKKKNMMTCFPKYLNNEWLNGFVPQELAETDWYMLSCGTGKNDHCILMQLLNKLSTCLDINPKFICIDVANGYMTELITTCEKIRTKLPNVTIMAGNVVTPDGVNDLVTNGLVDIVKIGIGSGLCCTTRKITGVGYPQLSAVLETSEKAHELGAHVVSDGGVTNVGDISKALCAGGDFVMLGSMLAGHDISPGEAIVENGQHFKIVYGMSSTIANNKYAGGLGWYKAPEGKVVKMPYKGNISDTLQRIEGGIRSTCSYIGAETIEEMNNKSTFIIVNRQYNNTLDAFVIDE